MQLSANREHGSVRFSNFGIYVHMLPKLHGFRYSQLVKGEDIKKKPSLMLPHE